MKHLFLALLGCVVCLAGLTPATASASTGTVTLTRSSQQCHYHHRRWIPGHYRYRHGRRYWVPGHYRYY